MERAKNNCAKLHCNIQGRGRTIESEGIKTLVKSAELRKDHDFVSFLQALLSEKGDEAALEMHKTCYCSYTSTNNIEHYLIGKRKIDEPDLRNVRVRRSQVVPFDYRTLCLFCTSECKPIDPRNPTRWREVKYCERKGVEKDKNLVDFKQSVLNLCDKRGDCESDDVQRRCDGVFDLGAAEARYHKDCYNKFRKNPENVFSVTTPDYALKKICEDIHKNRLSNTWSTSELFEKYKEYDGELQSQSYQTLNPSLVRITMSCH